VRGIRDESDALIRLADSIAGFVRDAIEGKAYAQPLYQEATRKSVIRELIAKPWNYRKLEKG